MGELASNLYALELIVQSETVSAVEVWHSFQHHLLSQGVHAVAWTFQRISSCPSLLDRPWTGRTPAAAAAVLVFLPIVAFQTDRTLILSAYYDSH